MTIGLIDGDIVAYRNAISAENDPVEVALMRVEKMMVDILSHFEEYKVFLSGKNNFRYEIYPEYKANRKDTPRPIHLDACRSYLISEYNAVVTDGYEADDALGFSQTEETVICSIDKDLLMIPGAHYNFIKNEYREVSELDGLKSFYRSMLVGDTSDNVFGVKGIGKVKAAKLIDPLETEKEMYNLVYKLYENDEQRFRMNCDCLWIQRVENERYSDRYKFT